MFSQDQPPQQLNSLTTLNFALLRLDPSISGIALSDMQTTGANVPIFDFVIGADATTLYNGIKRGELIRILQPALAARVNTHSITLTYDTHGDKHFPGGPPGTKFTAGKTVVNPVLETLIRAQIGRIRRDANGRSQTYYLSERPNQYTNGESFAIQIDYTASPEGITYHGYPRDVRVYVLSRTLGGVAIAA